MKICITCNHAPEFLAAFASYYRRLPDVAFV